MTDKQAANIILIITFIVLVIICYQCESTQAAIGAFICMWALLYRAGKAASAWLDRIEDKEKSKLL